MFKKGDQQDFNNYRPNYLTNHALITIAEKIRKAIDNREITGGAFLDLQKAFDTIDHEILLTKLEHGIRGVPLTWFKLFSLNDTNMFPSKILYQKLSLMIMPLLFLIYINDLHQVTKHAEIHYFVDNTNLVDKIQISRQKINMKEAKYLGMVMDEHLTFENHMGTVKLKLNRANDLLAKLRHSVNPTSLRTIYYAIFEPHL